jgi:hypothetical protein
VRVWIGAAVDRLSARKSIIRCQINSAGFAEPRSTRERDLSFSFRLFPGCSSSQSHRARSFAMKAIHSPHHPRPHFLLDILNPEPPPGGPPLRARRETHSPTRTTIADPFYRLSQLDGLGGSRFRSHRLITIEPPPFREIPRIVSPSEPGLGPTNPLDSDEPTGMDNLGPLGSDAATPASTYDDYSLSRMSVARFHELISFDPPPSAPMDLSEPTGMDTPEVLDSSTTTPASTDDGYSLSRLSVASFGSADEQRQFASSQQRGSPEINLIRTSSSYSLDTSKLLFSVGRRAPPAGILPAASLGGNKPHPYLFFLLYGHV